MTGLEAMLELLKAAGYCAVAWLLAPYFWAAFRWAVVDPADALLHKLKSLPPVPRFLAVLVLCVSIVFGDKPSTNGTDGVNAPLPPMLQMRQMVGDPPPADEPSALAITAFSKSTNGVGFAMDWIPGLSLACLDLLYSEHLDTNDWSILDRWTVSPTQTNDMRFVSFGGSFTNAVSGFFGLRGYTYDADPDGDRLSVGEELRLGTDPFAADTEDDGLSDFEEACGFEQASSSNWIDYRMFPEGSLWNFAEFRSASGLSSAGRIPLTNAVHRLDRTFTACAVDPNGLVHLYESSSGSAVYQHSENWDLSESPVDVRAFTIAPFWTALEFGTQSVVRVFGRSSQFLVVEFDRMCLAAEPHVPENEVSVQVMMPLAASDYIAVCYYRGIGALANSRAVIGYRAPGTSARTTYSYLGSRPVSSDCVGFRACLGTDPCSADSDNDGLSDGEEVSLVTDPNRPDTDADGIPDGWEFLYGLDPLDADDSTLDSDGDGLTNVGEYQNGCDPGETDTDGDGTDDATEVAQGSDPSDSQDGGVAPPAEAFRELAFNIYGDYAAWELTVEGLGPQDRRMRHVTMTEPDVQQDVKLKLRKGNAYRLSMHWLNCDGHSDCYRWYCWQTRIDGLPAAKSYDDYSSARLAGNEIVSGPGWIAENAGGLLTAHVHEHDPQASGYGGGNVAEGLTATLYVLDDPRLVPDYDRDGEIGETDAALARQGKVFRFWINDDNDSGDTNDSENDRPGSGPNHADDHVDGKCDLLDFTPVWIDRSEVFPPDAPFSISNAVTWKVRSSCAKAVWSYSDRENAGAFQKQEGLYDFGPAFSDLPEYASVTNLAEGAELPSLLAQAMRSDPDKGVFLIEGCAPGTNLVVEGWCSSSSSPVVSNCAKICITPVEDMYWFRSLYGAESNMDFIPASVAAPTNLWDAAVIDKDVFFTHGFRVDEPDSHAWGAEAFKRFWQSGSNARFHMFTWAGAYGWPDSGLYYPQNAYQAQMSGGALKRLIEGVQTNSSKRILMTQSLGNMVACEALREGLQVAQYYMFDAALPSESIDETLRVESSEDAGFTKYVRTDWRDYTNACWASNWYRFFENDPNDSRGSMKWPGRFTDALTNATEVFNYYSSGDSVFHETEDPPWLLEGVLESTDNYCWQKQETLKGFRMPAGTAYGGWGFHRWRIGGFDYQYTRTEAANMVVDGSITNNSVFDRGYAPMLSGGASKREVFMSLAKYVPALSSPVGGNTVLGRNRDFDLNSDTFRNGWGRPAVKNQTPWLHSDMKDMAFFYVYKLYEQLVQKGSLK